MKRGSATRLDDILNQIEKYIRTYKNLDTTEKRIYLSRNDYDYLIKSGRVKKLCEDRAMYRNEFVLVKK